jgi:DNA-binding FadR family transcriptional regulator
MTALQPLRRPLFRKARSNHDHVARLLGRDILSGAFKPGELLPSEAALMNRFQLSRTILREAMKTLSAKGLVDSKTRVGTRVLDSTSWNFFDADLLAWRVELGLDDEFRANLAEIRLAVEPAAASLAAQRRSSEDMKALRKSLALMAEPGHSRESFAEADLAFHLAIAAASGNPLMRSMAAVIEAALIAAFSLTSPVDETEALDVALTTHARIVDAIEARDADAAAAAMVHVIQMGHLPQVDAPPLLDKRAHNKSGTRS